MGGCYIFRKLSRGDHKATLGSEPVLSLCGGRGEYKWSWEKQAFGVQGGWSCVEGWGMEACLMEASSDECVVTANSLTLWLVNTKSRLQLLRLRSLQTVCLINLLLCKHQFFVFFNKI